MPDIKDKYMEALKKAGFTTDVRQGVPMVFVGSPSEFGPVGKKLKKIAESIGYECSWGMAVKAGTSSVKFPDTEPEIEEEPEMDDIPEESNGNETMTVDDSGQMSFI